MARHATGKQEKEARRAAILHAARGLFLAGSGDLPTAAEIARVTGLAKGTVYLYFRTKEEIFAALLLEGWSAVMDSLSATLAAAKGRRADRIAAMLHTLVQHLGAHPELLRLDALGYGVLEKNMELEALRTHKQRFTERLLAAGEHLEQALGLAHGRGVQLLMRTYALTRGLWQATQHPEQIKLAMGDSALMLAQSAYGDELAEALAEYWRGAMVGKRSSPSCSSTSCEKPRRA